MNCERGTAEIVDGTRVLFTCSRGHVWIEDLNRKSLPVSKRVGAIGVHLLVRYWQQSGVTLDCRKCSQSRKGER